MAAKVRYFIVLSKQGKEGRGGVPLQRCQRQRIGQDTTPAWIETGNELGVALLPDSFTSLSESQEHRLLVTSEQPDTSVAQRRSFSRNRDNRCRLLCHRR